MITFYLKVKFLINPLMANFDLLKLANVNFTILCSPKEHEHALTKTDCSMPQYHLLRQIGLRLSNFLLYLEY